VLGGGGGGLRLNDLDWLSVMLSHEPVHLRHGFEDEGLGMPWTRAKFQVVCFFAPQFAELRRRVVQGGEMSYVTSLSRCVRWAQRGGKSNAYFAKTRDDRYIIKSMSKAEKASFLEFAPAYFEHAAKSALSGQRTCLAKVLGMYQVTAKTPTGASGLAATNAGKDGVLDLLVMENCFYDQQISRIYDLKGSERNRFNADAAANPHDAKEVHLDENLRRANLSAPLMVTPASQRQLELALWADTAFLSGLAIMDYSLLVGVDKDDHVLAVAIIDFIRQYTWDKQLETWVKGSGILGGGGKEPTIISPKQYMRRFRTAIMSYFTVVPGSAFVSPSLPSDM